MASPESVPTARPDGAGQPAAVGDPATTTGVAGTAPTAAVRPASAAARRSPGDTGDPTDRPGAAGTATRLAADLGAAASTTATAHGMGTPTGDLGASAGTGAPTSNPGGAASNPGGAASDPGGAATGDADTAVAAGPRGATAPGPATSANDGPAAPAPANDGPAASAPANDGPAAPAPRSANNGAAAPAGGAATAGGRAAGRVALVTGATAGIGAAFARALAAEGYDLVLVARDAERLAGVAAELAHQHGIRAAALPADLATEAGCATVGQRLAERVDLLVNNAGRSLHTSFLKATTEQEEQMLALNVHAVMRLTHAALRPMVDAGHGDIINVSSASAFAAMMPGSTYPATKAWVNAFTESVALSVRPFGVRLLTLCPGYTRTEFHDRQGIDTSKMPDFLWLDADDVARTALRDLRKGKLLSVPDWRYKTAVFAMRHAPRALIQRAARDGRGRISR